MAVWLAGWQATSQLLYDPDLCHLTPTPAALCSRQVKEAQQGSEPALWNTAATTTSWSTGEGLRLVSLAKHIQDFHLITQE